MRPVVGVMPLWDDDKDSLWMLPGYLEGLEEAGTLPLILPLTDDEEDLAQLVSELVEAGLAPKEVSGGSTGTVETKPGDSVYTEMQCGSYIFMDRAYRDMNLCFRNALFLLAGVVSVKPDRIVTDAGTKSLGMDQGDPVFVGFENIPVKMSEEHAQIAAPGHGLRLNDKVRLIPGHCCTTMNSHDKLYVVDGDEVVDVWPIVSRGKCR